MRILSRLLTYWPIQFIIVAIILLCVFAITAHAQTAAIPPLPVPIPATTAPLPAVVQRAQVITITTPKNGGKVQFTIPQQTLLDAGQTTTKATTSSTAATTVPVTNPKSFTFTCPDIPALPNGQPDLTKPLVCTAKAQ